MLRKLALGALGVGGVAAALTLGVLGVGSGGGQGADRPTGGDSGALGDRPLPVREYDVTNGVFEAGAGVVQFPAVFHCIATAVGEPSQSVRFVVPTTGVFRISIDPNQSSERVTTRVRIEQGEIEKTLTFSNTLDFAEQTFAFEKGSNCLITITADLGKKYYWGYDLGIGLDDVQVTFDLNQDAQHVYGELVDPRYGDEGVNMTTNYPFGYLPKVKEVHSEQVKFLGWFAEREGGTALGAASLVGTNEVYYAHWQLPTFTYYVSFDKSADAAKGSMDLQSFTTGVSQPLSRNLFYWGGHKFAGWATERGGAVRYADRESVLNLCQTPYGTCPLYAVWQDTGATNYFVVSSGVTNFTGVVVAPDAPTFFEAEGSGIFSMDTMNMTNAVTCRLSIDPKAGSSRVNAKLIVEKGVGSREKGVGEVVWTNICEVTDLATNEVLCAFTNGVYRFTVTNAPPSYVYTVGLGAVGATLDFAPVGGAVKPGSLSDSLTFNWTVGSPYGYLPDLVGGSGTFMGWFDAPDMLTGNQVFATNTVVGSKTAFARWSNQTFYVAFDGNGATGGKMAPQAFAWNVPQALDYNQYYKRGQHFAGWADSSTGALYADHEVVSNLCATAGGTNGLCAVWEPSTGTNVYYVTAGMTNFANIALSPREPSFFMGHGDTACFTVTPANLGEATKCRVSIDPDGGFRTNALLTIDRALAAATRVAWTNVCTVTDLSEKEVTCTFSTNYQYRFTISGVAPSYAYSVGVGAAGSQYTFEPCGGTVSPSAPVKNLSFNWTVDAPLGYLPPLTNDVKYGTYAWHYTPNANETNLVFATNHVAASATTCYAHWSKGVIVPIVLDWNLTSYGVATNVVVTNYYGQGTKMSLPRPSYENWGFLGWTTNRLATSGWLPDTVVISNTATYFGQWSKEWRLSVYNGGWSIDGHNGTWVGPLALPSYIAPKNVYAVGASAFKGQALITSLAIPAGVTFVGDAAFEECAALKSVVFPSVYPESEYAEDGFLDNEIELGTDLFLNCTALTDVQLPLGVWRLPDGIFCGCTALTAMDMPYTIREIGVGAFNHCNHLQELVVTEGVDALESCAFETCTRMRKISFIGNPPESVEGDIFKGTQRNLLVGYLQNMCETAKAYCGGTWPALPGTWPEGSEYARTLTWIGEGLYPRYKVSFNHNDGDTPATSPVTPVLYHAGRVFGLMAPTEDVMGEGFSGWWTQPVGGRKIGNYREVTAGMTVYAHWETMVEEPEIGSRSDEDYPVYWDPENEDFTGFYSADDDLFYYSACAFNGIVVDEGGVMAGTIAFTFREGGMTDDGMSAPVTASVAWTGGKSLSLSGRVDADGLLVAKNRTWAFADTTVTKSGIYGTLVDETEGVTYKVYAARNRYAMSTDAARTVVLTALQATRGTWHVVLQTESAESEEEGAAAFAEGYTTLAITIAGMGQATIEGTTGDGAKISTTATLIVGDGCAALPVVVRPYSGRGGFSFFIWFAWQSDGSIGEDETRIHGLTAWDATRAAHPFTATFYGAPDPDPSDFPVTFIDDKRYEGGAMFDCEDVSAELVIKGTTWKVVGENPNKVKLTYQAATGFFTGSFTVETSEGKTARATVSGAFTDRILEDCTDLYHGYGTAVISDVGSFPVEVTTTE